MNGLAGLIATAPRDLPVLVAGPTASGKSALALALAEVQGRPVVNADALQVWDCWRVLTARPSTADEARVSHLLYGHRTCGNDYSVGHWLREVEVVLERDPGPIIVGGTGLYLSALTEGLAAIPPVPPEIRAEADLRRDTEGPAALLAEIDAPTAARIDRRNPARVQRAWEVLRATGRGLADWQADTGRPLVARGAAFTVVIDAPRDWLRARIDARFDAMLAAGALDEVRAVLPRFRPSAPWARAIGAAELARHLAGEITLAEATEAAKKTTHQYAKRQRTWFRNRMSDWMRLPAA